MAAEKFTPEDIANEIWKPVVRYEGLYEASTFGRVRSIGRRQGALVGRILKGSVFDKGRVRLEFRKDGRRVSISKASVIALTFIGPRPSPAYEVNHKNGDPSNDTPDNLEWATRSENILHAFQIGLNHSGESHPHAKLTDADVIEIRHLLKTKSLSFIAKQFNIGTDHVSRIKTGKKWTHLKS